MSLISRIALSLAAASAPGAIAMAADYDPPIYVEDTVVEVPVEIGSGWYLRGDIGYAIDTSIGPVTYRTFDPVPSTYGEAAFASQDLDSDFTWGGGFGYSFNEWVRADLTVDGFRADFSGTTTSALPCVDPGADPTFAGTTCRSEDGSEVSAVSVMANAYADFGTFVGVTPYLGAGIGASYLSWSSLDGQLYCVDDVNPCPAPGGGIPLAQHAGEDGWRLTYALMAGFAYDLANNFKLDVGYKYRHIDGGSMFGWDAPTALLGATGTQGSHGDINQHEVRVGLRYEIW